MTIVTAGKFHSQECLVEYGLKKTEHVIKKAKTHKKKVHAKQKRDFYDKDIKTRREAAKSACHAYIRARDYGRPCICCNRSTATGKVNAGHYHESGNNPLIRFDEDNIHLQLEYCNTYQHGDSGDYRPNLIKKIGAERVERLDGLKGGTLKRTADDYRKIEEYYKEKIKQHKAENQ
jgi:hypothetical protein